MKGLLCGSSCSVSGVHFHSSSSAPHTPQPRQSRHQQHQQPHFLSAPSFLTSLPRRTLKTTSLLLADPKVEGVRPKKNEKVLIPYPWKTKQKPEIPPPKKWKDFSKDPIPERRETVTWIPDYVQKKWTESFHATSTDSRPSGAILFPEDDLSKEDVAAATSQKDTLGSERFWPMARDSHIRNNQAQGCGGRKSSEANAVIFPGTGQILINNRNFVEYFQPINERTRVMEPFMITETMGRYDARIIVRGGGITGQSCAVRQAISDALQTWEPQHRATLKKAGFLRRDSRIVERKKPGQKKARKKFQWSKR